MAEQHYRCPIRKPFNQADPVFGPYGIIRSRGDSLMLRTNRHGRHARFDQYFPFSNLFAVPERAVLMLRQNQLSGRRRPNQLVRIQPSPVAYLNRAVAIAMCDGPEAGLKHINAVLEHGELANYYLAHAARAELYRTLARTAEALASY
jgi:hypothetical protein